eukprot:31378-Pelagococcus_subviridis.AAC.3
MPNRQRRRVQGLSPEPQVAAPIPLQLRREVPAIAAAAAVLLLSARLPSRVLRHRRAAEPDVRAVQRVGQDRQVRQREVQSNLMRASGARRASHERRDETVARRRRRRHDARRRRRFRRARVRARVGRARRGRDERWGMHRARLRHRRVVADVRVYDERAADGGGGGGGGGVVVVVADLLRF